MIEPAVVPELALPVASYLPIAGADHAVAFAFGEAHGCIVAEPSSGTREARCFLTKPLEIELEQAGRRVDAEWRSPQRSDAKRPASG